MTPARSKEWVRVQFADGPKQSFVPTFRDLFLIWAVVAECEEAKYPQASGKRGRKEIGRFLRFMAGLLDEGPLPCDLDSWEKIVASFDLRELRDPDKLQVVREMMSFGRRAA